MQTIKAKVSARILSKADRLFTNRLSQIFVELLQNARRAGASLVTVTTSPSPTDSTSLITFTDNGSGIEDFNKLLHLGESGWDQAVERAEDPAGMGLFALLHTGVVVRSRGKPRPSPPMRFWERKRYRSTTRILLTRKQERRWSSPARRHKPQSWMPPPRRSLRPG